MLTTYIKREHIALLIFAVAFLLFIPASRVSAITALTVNPYFHYAYMVDGTLDEAGTMSDSLSPYWWVNSGAKLILSGGTGMTVHGSLSSTDPWRVEYATTNPTDTDNGYHPQNIFRLVSRSTWDNIHVESLYKIDKDNFSASPNRNSSNGLLLMLRYHMGGQTLYYAGIRVDGTAVLKKKINGVYYTMAQKQIFPGTYSVAGNVNLLPHNAWMTLGADAMTNANGSVSVRLYLTQPGQTTPTKIFDVTDSGQYGGTAPITGANYVGIRTDFMDVSFDDFKAISI
jgi:hypothetical protein